MSNDHACLVKDRRCRHQLVTRPGISFLAIEPATYRPRTAGQRNLVRPVTPASRAIGAHLAPPNVLRSSFLPSL